MKSEVSDVRPPPSQPDPSDDEPRIERRRSWRATQKAASLSPYRAASPDRPHQERPRRVTLLSYVSYSSTSSFSEQRRPTGEERRGDSPEQPAGRYGRRRSTAGERDRMATMRRRENRRHSPSYTSVPAPRMRSEEEGSRARGTLSESMSESEISDVRGEAIPRKPVQEAPRRQHKPPLPRRRPTGRLLTRGRGVSGNAKQTKQHKTKTKNNKKKKKKEKDHHNTNNNKTGT